MVRCDGEGRRTGVCLPKHAGRAHGGCARQGLFLGFAERVHTSLLLSGPPPRTLKMKRNGATQLKSGPSTPGTSSSPSSSGSRFCCACLEPLQYLTQERALEGEARTDLRNTTAASAPPPGAIFWATPCHVRTDIIAPPSSLVLLHPFLHCLCFLSFLFSPA